RRSRSAANFGPSPSGGGRRRRQRRATAGSNLYFTFSAGELFAGVSALPFSNAVLVNLPPSLVIFVVHPVSHVITALFPLSFHVPVIGLGGRFAEALPPAASVISNGLRSVWVTSQPPSTPPAAKLTLEIAADRKRAEAAAAARFMFMGDLPSSLRFCA